jgi:hypothetical protein
MVTQETRSRNSLALALAAQSCSICFGLGIRPTGPRQTCGCVWRRIFRICYERFRECSAVQRAQAEFRADFCHLAQLTLTPPEQALFSSRFLLGAPCSACCRRLGLDRGKFFHSVYRIQEKLGLAFHSEGLFPLDNQVPTRSREQVIAA